VDQGDENTAARRADGVPQSDCPAVNVYLAGIPLEFLVYRHRLRSKRLVGFDQVEIIDCPAGTLEGVPGGADRTGTHDCRVNTGIAVCLDGNQWLQSQRFGFFGAADDDGSGPIVDGGRVTGGNPPVAG